MEEEKEEENPPEEPEVTSSHEVEYEDKNDEDNGEVVSKSVLEAGAVVHSTVATVVNDMDGLDDELVDPVTLAARSSRRGSRFSTDGTPLLLRAFLESASPALNFQFQFKEKQHQFTPLENEFDRRVLGRKTRFEMHEGEFRLPEPFRCPTLPDSGRYRVSDVYHVTIDPELVIYVGLIPGWKVPVITDCNPHQEGMIDHHRVVYLPYTEEKNTFMELPNSPGLFFTSQLISGGEIVIAYDRSLHKYWVIAINQVYTPPKYSRNDVLPSKEKMNTWELEESSWRRVVENNAYCDRVVDLLMELGNNVHVVVRVSPVTAFFRLVQNDMEEKKHSAQQRLDNYFREEILECGGTIRHYYYEREAIVYGFHENGEWKFGIKDRSKNNGYSIYMKTPKCLYASVKVASYPL